MFGRKTIRLLQSEFDAQLHLNEMKRQQIDQIRELSHELGRKNFELKAELDRAQARAATLSGRLEVRLRIEANSVDGSYRVVETQKHQSFRPFADSGYYGLSAQTEEDVEVETVFDKPDKRGKSPREQALRLYCALAAKAARKQADAQLAAIQRSGWVR